MNLQHLKYAVEVEKTGSITQAAENLYMGQPNLSKAIKELEGTLGVILFKRTSKGVLPTAQGKEFLRYAKSILDQVERMEELYRSGGEGGCIFLRRYPAPATLRMRSPGFLQGWTKPSSWTLILRRPMLPTRSTVWLNGKANWALSAIRPSTKVISKICWKIRQSMSAPYGILLTRCCFPKTIRWPMPPRLHRMICKNMWRSSMGM